MAEYIKQGHDQLKHLSLLRKIIRQKMTGHIHAITGGKQEKISMSFCLGDFVKAEGCTLALRKFISWPIIEYQWQACAVSSEAGWTEPAEALSQALTNLPIHKARLNTYRCTFSKLANMRLQTVPIHRYNFGDVLEYQNLYHLSLQEESFHLAVYFKDVRSERILLSRIRSLLLVFLMGHIVQARQSDKVSRVSKQGVASRIMRLLRAKI